MTIALQQTSGVNFLPSLKKEKLSPETDGIDGKLEVVAPWLAIHDATARLNGLLNFTPIEAETIPFCSRVLGVNVIATWTVAKETK